MAAVLTRSTGVGTARPSPMTGRGPPLVVPPLLNRRADIRLLAEHFVRLHAPHGQLVKFTPAALTKLQRHLWPGNVRELRNVVHRALLACKGPNLDASVLLLEERSHRAPLELLGLARSSLFKRLKDWGLSQGEE